MQKSFSYSLKKKVCKSIMQMVIKTTHNTNFSRKNQTDVKSSPTSSKSHRVFVAITNFSQQFFLKE